MFRGGSGNAAFKQWTAPALSGPSSVTEAHDCMPPRGRPAGRIGVPLTRPLMVPVSGAVRRQPASSRTTVSTRSTAGRVVRKLVMQARSAKRPSTFALDR